MNLPGFRKKALLKTVSTAAAGIDMEGMKIEFDEEEKKVVIQNMPEVEILYVTSQYTYYDLSEGIFNNFTKKELNALNTTADSIMMEKIKSSDLLDRANAQNNELFELLNEICKSGGWELVIRDSRAKIIEHKD